MNKISNEFQYLIHLICSAIHSTKPAEIPDGLDFEKVLEIAEAHDVANIAFYSIERLEHKPCDEVYSRFRELYVNAVMRDVNQTQVYEEITDAFHKNNIRTLEAQGTLYKPLYPSPEWRTMGDIDIIVDRENCEKAREILKSIGYYTEGFYNEDFNAFSPSGVFVEIHYGYFYDDHEFENVIPDPFEKSKKLDGDLSYAADDDSFCLYGILHLLKHFNRGGVGIRRMADMYYLKQNFDLNTNYINGVLNQFNYKPLVDLIFRLCDVWFENKPYDSKTEELENIINISGTHGTNKNYYNLMAFHFRLQGKRCIKLRCFIDMVLLDKDRLYDMSPFFKKHQLPLWICRMLRPFVSVSKKINKKIL